MYWRLNSCFRYIALFRGVTAVSVSWHVTACSGMFTTHLIALVIRGQCVFIMCQYNDAQ